VPVATAAGNRRSTGVPLSGGYVGFVTRPPATPVAVLLLALSACGIGSDGGTGDASLRMCQATAFARSHPTAELEGELENMRGDKRELTCMFTLPVPSSQPPATAACRSPQPGRVNVMLVAGQEVARDASPPDTPQECYVRPS
jgi:hypothetical protein